LNAKVCTYYLDILAKNGYLVQVRNLLEKMEIDELYIKQEDVFNRLVEIFSNINETETVLKIKKNFNSKLKEEKISEHQES